MALDSDVSNADANLHVEFYEFKGEGHFNGKPFVKIVVPGDKTNIIDQPAREDHKRRFQRQWLHYQMQHNDGTVIGTPLMQWHRERPEELLDGQLQELVILKFQSVEQIAQASDSQIQRIGMGAAGMRERARSYLASKSAQISGAHLNKQAAEIEELKAMVQKLSMMQAAAPLVAAKPKGKPGRKKKVKSNVQHDAAIGATDSQ